MQLKNVVLVRDENLDYRAEGNVYGSEHFDDGTLIVTGVLSVIDFDEKVLQVIGISNTFKYEFEEIKEIRLDFDEEKVSLEEPVFSN
jgi:hypothetical protein